MRVRSFALFVLFACVVCVGHTPAASAQMSPRLEPRDPVPQVSEPMRALQFLAGKWQGKVRYAPGADPHSEVVWTSHVHYNLGGKILLIDERGSELANPDQITREVLVAVYWDPAAKAYPARFYISTKDGVVSLGGKAEVQDGTFVLHIPAPGEQYRFSVRLNEEGQWYEVGETSRDGGGSWTRIFEMTLSRQEQIGRR